MSEVVIVFEKQEQIFIFTLNLFIIIIIIIIIIYQIHMSSSVQSLRALLKFQRITSIFTAYIVHDANLIP
jgi:hypothetical protein